MEGGEKWNGSGKGGEKEERRFVYCIFDLLTMATVLTWINISCSSKEIVI